MELKIEKKCELDQFYTNPIISDKLVGKISELFPIEFKKAIFLEPSAGTGNFLWSLQKKGINIENIKGYDLDPKNNLIEKADYLKTNIEFNKKRIILGNPPFGKRAKLALEFLNKSLKESNIVCFILPNTFNRYSIQKNIDESAKLVFSEPLDLNSFIFNNKKYNVNCVFQIWVKIPTKLSDKRIKKPPVIRHDDFETYIHNNTKETLKYFNKKEYKWNFAVHRQGYYDYSVRIHDEKELIKNRQYFFIKVKNKDALKIIKKIDFKKLSRTNTQILGFSTSDFVNEYINIKEKTYDTI